MDWAGFILLSEFAFFYVLGPLYGCTLIRRALLRSNARAQRVLTLSMLQLGLVVGPPLYLASLLGSASKPLEPRDIALLIFLTLIIRGYELYYYKTPQIALLAWQGTLDPSLFPEPPLGRTNELR